MYAALLVAQPSLEEAHFQLIRTRLEMNDLKGAIAAIQKAASSVPDSASVWASAGDLQYRLSQFQQAAESYRQALQRDPNSARANLGMGRLNQIASMNKTARDYFNKAYAQTPTDPDIAWAWAKSRGTPAEIAKGLEDYLQLATFRTPDHLASARRQIAQKKYLGDREECTLSSPPAATTIPLKEITAFAQRTLPVIGLGPTSVGLQVSINAGKARTATLDASTRSIAVTSAYATELNMTRLPDVPGQTPQNYLAFADKVRIGSIELRNCFVSVLAVPSFGVADAVVSLSLLSDFLIALDLKKLDLRLNPASPVPAGENPNFRDAVVSENQRDFMRMFRVGPAVYFPVRVKDTDESLFGFAIQNSFTTISSTQPAAKGLSESPVTTGMVDSTVCSANCVKVTLGNINAKTTIQPLNFGVANHIAGIELGGNLGYGALRGRIITIDYNNGLFKFE